MDITQVSYLRLGVAAAAALGVAALFKSHIDGRRRRRGRPLPPGPKPAFLVGNAKDAAPFGNEGPFYAAWKEEYGPIAYMNILGTELVILNDLQSVEDLLVGRGAIYTDRPDFHMLKLSGWGWSPILLNYGPEWKEFRQTFDVFLEAGRISEFNRTLQHNNAILLQGLIDSPSRFRDHIYRLAGANSYKLAYGIDVGDQDDPWLVFTHKADEAITASTLPTGFLVNVAPWLRHVPDWVPGAGFKRQAKIWAREAEELVDAPLKWVRDRMASDNQPPPSFTLETLALGKDPSLIKGYATAMYFAGADTTVNTIAFFIMAMAQDPPQQYPIQAELDAVVGHGRLPDYTDRDALPRVESLVREVFRRYPIAPMSVPHRVRQDDEYKGMFIPKDAMVLPNLWAILHDPVQYPDPLNFKSDRFLTPSGLVNDTIPNPKNVTFGMGRRRCPGRHLGDAIVWLEIACILACFEIRRTKDAEGQDIVPNGEIEGGAAVKPKSFVCEFVPRHAGVAQIIAETFVSTS